MRFHCITVILCTCSPGVQYCSLCTRIWIMEQLKALKVHLMHLGSLGLNSALFCIAALIMKCKKCGEIKLSKEFPPFTLIGDCEHPPLHCLRCVTTYWETHKSCSQCDLPVDVSELNLRKCWSMLETLFPEITCDDIFGDEGVGDSSGGSITVTRLNGESFDTPFMASMSVYSLKKKIEQFMKVSPDKQSLLYNQKQLKDYKDDHSGLATLSDFGVKPNTTMHLMVLLYAVPSHLDHVVFDLSWGYPSHKRDYLDAVAMTFNGQKWLQFVSWRNKQCANGAIKHSGDMMDDMKRRGHHIINVRLKSIPSEVTHVFFTLSSYHSPTISHYKTPSMRFYEESNPEQMLCTEQISKAGHKQAIVMCSLMRSGNQWLVHSNGALSNGNLPKFEPLIETCQGLAAKTGNYLWVPFKVHYSKAYRP